MEFEFINPLNFPGWDDLVLSAGDYSFFHCTAWTRVLCESYGYRPSFFAMTEKAKLLAVIPFLEVNSFLTGRRAVSLPFSDYCEPLVFGQPCFSDIPGSLIEAAKKAGWKHLDFRGQSIFAPGIPVWSRYAGHRLKLSNAQELRSKLHTNTVRNLKKAKARGIEIEVLDSFEGMGEYYRLHCLTRKRQAAPPQPFYFFKKIQEHICSKGKGRVILARYRGKAVAGAVFFHFGQKALYKYGALDMDFGRLGASAAVMWEAVSQYAAEGRHSFCFGRTDLDHQGLRRFKLGFGAEEYFLDYRRFDVSKNGFVEGAPKNRLPLSGFMKHMPLPGLKAVGLAYRHFG
ncbi:MAG: GNAT family N-acetyltransferase [Syntrophobacteraceae bacterium]|nr:GNAT family N-acetyltransferase [Syntrophobacteraceae bacterium]